MNIFANLAEGVYGSCNQTSIRHSDVIVRRDLSSSSRWRPGSQRVQLPTILKTLAWRLNDDGQTGRRTNDVDTAFSSSRRHQASGREFEQYNT